MRGGIGDLHAQHAGSIVWRPAGRDSSLKQCRRVREVRDDNSLNPLESAPTGKDFKKPVLMTSSLDPLVKNDSSACWEMIVLYGSM